ncbi:MAG: HTH domain-containing protein [Verrucomicrobia bacterium]|nr:HTH domain-containing protein [Verrucomicrobiota bacterium]
MNDIRDFKRYLSDSLGLDLDIRKSSLANKLPHFLNQNYDFGETQILGEAFVLMRLKSTVGMTPASLKKHWAQVRAKQEKNVLLILPATSSYDRRRYIEYKIPFVVPGNQCYLPQLGIDLREHFKRIVESGSKPITPSAQFLLLHLLYVGRNSNDQDHWTASELAQLLGYSNMTITRAIDELEKMAFLSANKSGRTRIVSLDADFRELWKEAKDMMQSPVSSRKRIHTSLVKDQSWPLAGLSALAEQSMLSGPKMVVRATSHSGWLEVENRYIWLSSDFDDREETEFMEIEKWRYDPKLFQKDERVDILSLYLSLKDHSDERVQMALEEALEESGW